MAQVTIYLTDDVAAEARRLAARTRKSLSAFVAELVTREASRQSWPASLVELLREGRAEIEEPDDPSAEDVEPLR